MALDKLTGSVVWQSKEVNESAHYSSPEVATIRGIRQIVQFSNQSVFSVTLAEGTPLWRYPAPAAHRRNQIAS